MTGKTIIWRIVLIHLLLYLTVLCLHSCGMLKNTAKDKVSSEKTAFSKAELEKLDLSKAYRESKIYSYRPDGSVAAFEHRKEQVDAASLTKAKTEKKLEESTTAVHKKSGPAKLWTVGLLIVLLIILTIYFIKKHP